MNIPDEVMMKLVELVNDANQRMLNITGKPLEAVTVPVEMQMFEGAVIAGIPVLTRTAEIKFGRKQDPHHGRESCGDFLGPLVKVEAKP